MAATKIPATREASAKPSTNGRNGKRRSDGKVRVAIVGVGNCASSLVQGRYYYENARPGDDIPGLMHVDLGGYHIRDIEFVAAFDVDKNKVGKDLSEAIYTAPNNTYVFQQVPHTGVTVERGMTLDGLGVPVGDHREVARRDRRRGRHPEGARGRRHGSYLPVGSEDATKWYVEQALQAGVAFVNAIPVFIGREPYWQRRLPRPGCRSSATTSSPGGRNHHPPGPHPAVHGPRVQVDRTYQLNFVATPTS